MVSKKKNTSGLLGGLITRVFIPTVAAFIIIAGILFVNIHIGSFQFTSIRSLGLNGLQDLGDSILKESTNSLNKLGERLVEQKVNDVTKQVEIYMNTHPRMSVAALVNDPDFKQIVVQKFGETGYTCAADNTGVMILHPSAGAIGKDIHKSQMKEVAALTDLVVAKGFASGYYRWTESDGRVVNKFMALKVVPGRNIHIGSTTYMDEFSRPAKAITMATHTMENKLAHQYNQRFVLFGIVVALVLTVLLAFVYFFSLSVVKPIRELSDIADRISMGDLKAVVNVKGKGEVQVLAQSVERMQTSVKAAIERLQKRREAAAGSSSGEARQR